MNGILFCSKLTNQSLDHQTIEVKYTSSVLLS